MFWGIGVIEIVHRPVHLIKNKSINVFFPFLFQLGMCLISQIGAIICC